LNPGMLKWVRGDTCSMKKRLTIIVFAVAGFVLHLFFIHTVYAAAPLKFSVHHLDSHAPGATVLVVGGIQGDEPGGFNAAALMATHYKILSGRVIVVPNLNFPSIVKRSRGIHGDMNRKFDTLGPGDPESETIVRIKSMIQDPDVDVILNLHDGSGFYAATHVNRLRNPGRWGQSIIIDQEIMGPGSTKNTTPFSNLARAAATCAKDINQQLLEPIHRFHVKNTHTASGNKEMAKTLTFFALKHQKAAFGIEASKSFPTSRRVYYHLLAIESFLTQAGVGFERSFPLTEAGIRKAMDQDIALSLGNKRVLVFAENVRKRLNYIPMEKGRDIQFAVNHPLMTLVPQGDYFSLFHGNRQLTRLWPQYFEYARGLEGIQMVVDGEEQSIFFGSVVSVKDRFLVKHIPDHRVNIIGFSRQKASNESGFVVRRKNFAKRFSMDRAGRIFRVEVYESGKFNGMILVDFRPGNGAVKLVNRGNNPGGKKQFYQ